MKKEIATRTDIEFLVDEFYKKATKDEMIGHFFTEVVQLSWDRHLPVMYSFWETVLLGNMTYQGNPMLKHIALDKKSPLLKEHFERWEKLFFETLDEHFTGEKVELARKRASSIGLLMQHKITQSREDYFIQ